MWIPHNLLTPLKAETARPTIEASEAAKEERTFVVGFFLRNPVTRVWETDVLVSDITAHREITLEGKPCTADDSANVSGKLKEIVYTFSSTAAAAALATAFRHVAAELDRKALQYGRGFEIAGWRVADVTHGARWRCVPFQPSALKAELIFEETPQDYAEVLRLYREARNTTSAAWRLICAGAILDAAVAGRPPFAAPETDLGQHVITMDMLVRSSALTAFPELEGASVRTLRDVAEAPRRALLSEVTGLGAGTNDACAGDYQASVSLSALANLVDLVARDLVLASLRAAGYLRVATPVETTEPAPVV